MKTFAELFAEHDGKVSDKWEFYLTAYEEIFAKLRLKPISILEIGVQNGGSLELYAKYFSKAKKIIGCDINPACANLTFEDDRIRVVVGDCNDHATQIKIHDESKIFDLIIDDGSHNSHDIIQSFIRYFPMLADGGVFIVEDLHCSYWSEFGGGLAAPYSAIGFFKRLIDICNHQHWGVPKSRESLLSSFVNEYQLTMEAGFLEHINAIEFANSICIIYKSLNNNELGKRKVVGNEEAIVHGRLLSDGSESVVLDQSHNSFSINASTSEEMCEGQKLQIHELNSQIHSLAKEKDQKIHELNSQIHSLTNSLNALHRSIIWRLIAPLQKVKLALIKLIFRPKWYLKNNLDVAASGMDPWHHYCAFGVNEGRSIWLQPKIIKGTLSFAKKNGGILGASIKLLKIIIQIGPIETMKKIEIFLSFSSSLNYDASRDYENFIRLSEPGPSELEELRCLALKLNYKPIFSIVVPVFNVEAKWLSAFIDSVLAQVYPFWELCIADDCSTEPHIHEILDQYAGQDNRIKIFYRNANGHISAATNSALSLAEGEFICLMDNDDEIAPNALYEFASLLNKDRSLDMIYSDEDKIDVSGKRYEPFFKPDWSPETLEGCMYTAHFACYRMSIVRDIGFFRSDYDGAQDYDFVLRFTEKTSKIGHIPKVLYHWRAIPGSTAATMDSKDYVLNAALSALEDRAIRVGSSGVAKLGPSKGCFSLEYELSSTPLVSIIIPSAGKTSIIRGRKVDLLTSVISSICQKSNYKNIEIIIVDNGDLTDKTKNALNQYPCNFVSFSGPFNIASKMNLGAAKASGDYLLFMNDDVEVINSRWIESMLQLCQRDKIGVVGAKLYFEDGSLQHVGVVNAYGLPDHIHRGMPGNYPGYFFSAASNRNYLAVTGAVMMTKRSIFDDLEGFDINFQINYNDIDYCLRVFKKGFRIVFCAQAELFHYESSSRVRAVAPEEMELFKNRWSEFENCDPYYSAVFEPQPPNFNIRKNGFDMQNGVLNSDVKFKVHQ